MSFATLGPITFEVSADKVRTWSEAKRSGPARWFNHDVHGAKPVKEFLGPGNDSVNLSVRLDDARGLVPRDELRQMRLSRDTGEVLPFVVGGEPVADFVIMNIAETWTRLDQKGVLKVAVVELSLEEYH